MSNETITEPVVVSNHERQPQLSRPLITLLKGVIYQDQQPDIWNELLNSQSAVREYVKILGLHLYIDEAEGYSFLKQHPIEEFESNPSNSDETDEKQSQTPLPRLISRRPMSYPVSLLALLLRKRVIEQDKSGEETRVILSREQIIDMLRVYLPERSNETKTVNQIDSAINKIIELGFLRPLKNDTQHYEIRRIIKALINADWISNLQERLKEYKHYGNNIA